MTTIVPHRFLFRWAFRVPQCAPPQKGAEPPKLTEAHQLPSLTGLDGQAEFAACRLGWHEQGLAVDVTVTGRGRLTPPAPPVATMVPGVHVWIDTRGTQNVHRPTRYCHHFVLRPGSPKRRPTALELPLGASREAGGPGAATIRVASEQQDDGYRLRAWIPAESLTGYDPDSHAKLGFYFAVIDEELGRQTLTVDSAFPYHSDPSLWQTLELMR